MSAQVPLEFATIRSRLEAERKLRIEVRVTPRARSWSATVEDPDVPRILLRTPAPPVEGRANEAVIGFLSGALGIPASRVRVIGGEKFREKVVEVTL